MSTRDELFEKLIMVIVAHGIDIYSGIKEELEIVLSDYEVQRRVTEITVRHEDRNAFLIGKFIIAKTVSGRTDRTIRYYKSILEFIFERINKNADDIESDDIRLYLAVRQKRDGITRTSADNELRVLRTFYKYLVTEELVKKDPTIKIERIKWDTKKETAFTEIEVEKIRDCLKNAREKAIVETLLSTGCRVTELVQMKKEEVKDGAVTVHGKGGKDRICYLNAKALIALDNYLGERKDDNPYIFCRGKSVAGGVGAYHKKGKGEWYKNPGFVEEGHADKSSIEQMMRRIGKRCGVENVHPHRFRKTCATMALKRGMPIEKVSKMLGHEQLDTTKIYISIEEEEMAQAHKKYVI